MKTYVGIPARMGSSRFPGKPLQKILGIPMIEHVYKRCVLAKKVDEVFIATCDTEIMDEVRRFGGKAVMTSKSIQRPGLRVAEACKEMEIADDSIVTVVQGDEPLVHPEMLDLSIQPLLNDHKIKCLTLVADADEEEWLDPNEVKVTVDKNEDILFMSRTSIPSNIRKRIGPRLKQVAIMPYRKSFLLEFCNLSPMPLEIAESIEMLRILEHGIKIRTANSSAYSTMSVDTESDRLEAEKKMLDDELFQGYKRI